MKEKSKQHNDPEKQLGYRFKNFLIVSYRYSDPGSEFNKEDTGVSVTIRYLVSRDVSEMILRVQIALLPNGLQSDSIMEIVTQCEFDLQNASATEDGEELDLPHDFIGHMANIAIGTTRGVLLGKNFGTKISDFLLPLISTDEIVPKGSFEKVEPMGQK